MWPDTVAPRAAWGGILYVASAPAADQPVVWPGTPVASLPYGTKILDATLAVDASGGMHAAWSLGQWRMLWNDFINAGTKYGYVAQHGLAAVVSSLSADAAQHLQIAVQPGTATPKIAVAQTYGSGLWATTWDFGGSAQHRYLDRTAYYNISTFGIGVTSGGATQVLWSRPNDSIVYAYEWSSGRWQVAYSGALPRDRTLMLRSDPSSPGSLVAAIPVIDGSGVSFRIARHGSITGKVSLGILPLTGIAVSLEDSTPASAGGPKAVAHLVTRDGVKVSTTDPKSTDSLGKYSFDVDSTSSPSPTLPLRVKVTFDILDSTGRRNQYIDLRRAPEVGGGDASVAWPSKAPARSISTSLRSAPPPFGGALTPCRAFSPSSACVAWRSSTAHSTMPSWRCRERFPR